jgi:predicted DCC family thiol-disulfide oxidoreductase YuxK
VKRFDAWILYDAACGFCAGWVPFWSRLLAVHGMGVAPLQEPWVRARLPMPEEELLRDILVLEAGGRVHAGAEAYRFAFRRIPWAWPLELISRVPGGRRVFDATYLMFSRNRYRVSKSCRLNGRAA